MTKLRDLAAWSVSTRRQRRLVLASTLLAVGLSGYFMVSAEIGRVSSEVLRVALTPASLETVTAFGHSQSAGAAIAEGETSSGNPISDMIGQNEDISVSVPTNLAEASNSGIIPLSYSLEPSFNPGPGGLRVSKPIAVQGGDETELPLFLLNGTRIEIARGDLTSALARLGAADKASGLPELERLSLDQVRRAGLDLRYDAIRDRLMLVL